MKKFAIYWPGDYRDIANKAAYDEVYQSTIQLELALKKLGYVSYRIEGFITKPHEAIEKLQSITDPLIGIYSHWVYGTHTTDGMIGKNNPVLLVSNFSKKWPGLVGLLNTAACLTSVGKKYSRIWTSYSNWIEDQNFMHNLHIWCKTGIIDYPKQEIFQASKIKINPESENIANILTKEIKARSILMLMIGDTSMGMINGYFGPRVLNMYNIAEHKIDQAWIIDKGKTIDQKRINDALEFIKENGVKFYYNGDFTEESTKEQLRDYLVVLDLTKEFKADCIGWQYQLGLINIRPPSDLAEGLLNSICRPESNGDTIVTATEADQGNLIPMELMKRILKAKKLPQCVIFHDIRWGDIHDNKFIWLLLNSGSCSAYAFNHDILSLRNVQSFRQPKEYFPVPGGTFSGESLPGEITWARSFIKNNKLYMDIGYGEVIKLPEKIRDDWWAGSTKEWPFMAVNLGISKETLMAHYLSNHIAVAYGNILHEMVALSKNLGFEVRIFGNWQ